MSKIKKLRESFWQWCELLEALGEEKEKYEDWMWFLCNAFYDWEKTRKIKENKDLYDRLDGVSQAIIDDICEILGEA